MISGRLVLIICFVSLILMSILMARFYSTRNSRPPPTTSCHKNGCLSWIQDPPSAEKKDSLSEPPFGGANRLILSWAMRGIKKLDGVGSSREKCQILQPTLASFSWASTSQELLSRPSAVLYGALQSLEDPKYRLRRHT